MGSSRFLTSVLPTRSSRRRLFQRTNHNTCAVVCVCVVVVYGRVFSSTIESACDYPEFVVENATHVAHLPHRTSLVSCARQQTAHWVKCQTLGKKFVLFAGWLGGWWVVGGGWWVVGGGFTDRDLHVCKAGHLESRCHDVQKGLAEQSKAIAYAVEHERHASSVI